jgi:protein-disulfide isomerase
VAFLDYQCPFCAQANRDLESLAAAYPAEVALVFRHLPLVKIHPSAKEAALAAECAAMQGRFRAFHTLLYSSQDSIGVESWVSLAESAQVADLRRFDGCVTTGEARASLTRDSLAAKDLDVPGTPTLLINNLLILGYPGERALQEMVHDKLKEFRQ